MSYRFLKGFNRFQKLFNRIIINFDWRQAIICQVEGCEKELREKGNFQQDIRIHDGSKP
jgi:hypothetical protein